MQGKSYAQQQKLENKSNLGQGPGGSIFSSLSHCLFIFETQPNVFQASVKVPWLPPRGKEIGDGPCVLIISPRCPQWRLTPPKPLHAGFIQAVAGHFTGCDTGVGLKGKRIGYGFHNPLRTTRVVRPLSLPSSARSRLTSQTGCKSHNCKHALDPTAPSTDGSGRSPTLLCAGLLREKGNQASAYRSVWRVISIH